MTQEEYMKLPICQSCGMPMQSPEQYGRHADGSVNTEYCVYCCPEGEEKMQGMIETCAKIETKIGLHPDEATAKEKLAAYLPTLRRWKK